jgi:hypothetical protein
MAHGTDLESLIAEVLLDSKVRDSCGIYIHPWMFVHKIYQYFVESLLSPKFTGRNIDKKVLQLYMKQAYPDLLSPDWAVLDSIVDNFNPISDEDIDAVTNIVSTFIKDRHRQRGVDLCSKGMTKEAEPYLLESLTFRIFQNPFVNPNEPGALDRLREQDMPAGGRVIKSSFGLVNSVALYGGYKNADLIMVCMKTKGGKTLAMLQETAAAASQGFNVAHMLFGDYSEFDGICRLMSCITGADLADVVKNYNEYQKRCEKYLDYVRIAAFPARSKDIYETLAHLKSLKKQFDFSMCVVDYDGNLRPQKDENMYQTGDVVYGALKGFAKDATCAALIGCQCKPEFRDDEILGENAPNESSRKVMHVDFMICAGRNQKSDRVGTLTLPLVRRGRSGETSRVRFDYEHSRIEDITPQEYDRAVLEAQSRKNQPSGDVVLEGVKFEDKEL